MDLHPIYKVPFETPEQAEYRARIANWLLDESNHGDHEGWEDIRKLALQLRNDPLSVIGWLQTAPLTSEPSGHSEQPSWASSQNQD